MVKKIKVIPSKRKISPKTARIGKIALNVSISDEIIKQITSKMKIPNNNQNTDFSTFGFFIILKKRACRDFRHWLS